MELLKLAQAFCRMAKDTKPHRVIYLPRQGGMIATRIFPDLDKATDFAKSEAVKELLLIQPAEEKVPEEYNSRKSYKPKVRRTVPCEKCNGKNNRLVSDKMCGQCRGIW